MPINKYLAPLSEQDVAELQRLASLNFSTFNESDVREEFLVPLVRLLGYERNSDYQVLREKSYNLNPLFLKIGSTRIKLDYKFNVYKSGFWLLEAKKGETSKPGSPPEITEEMAGQAHFYAHHRLVDSPLYGVSNGWYTIIYDRDAEDPTAPILSIKHSELVVRFSQLQELIGASQVTFWIKRRLIARVEQVLAADVDLARSNEFVREVANAARRAEPKVLENFRRNAHLQEAAHSATLSRYLNETPPFETVDTLLLRPLSKGATRSACEILARRVAEYPGSNQLLFFDRLLVIEPRPVTSDYYFNALTLLAEMCRVPELQTVDFPRGDGKKSMAIRDLFADFTDLLLFHLSARPELRLMLAMEALVKRMVKRHLILTGAAREAIAAVTKLGRYLRPEEEIAYLGPSEARTLVEAVEAISLAELGLFFEHHYTKRNRQFDLPSALSEYQQRLAGYAPVESRTQQDYETRKAALGSQWDELTNLEAANVRWDRFGAGVCDVLGSGPIERLALGAFD